MRRRQYRPRAPRPGDELLVLEREMKVWLRVSLVRGDNPAGTFRRWHDFAGEWHEWSPREEADYVRWCLMEDGTSYVDADAEMREVVHLEDVPVGPRLVRNTATQWHALAMPHMDVSRIDSGFAPAA